RYTLGAFHPSLARQSPLCAAHSTFTVTFSRESEAESTGLPVWGREAECPTCPTPSEVPSPKNTRRKGQLPLNKPTGLLQRSSSSLRCFCSRSSKPWLGGGDHLRELADPAAASEPDSPWR
ncbi:hypothetical protein P7K49_024464, partial [Saguinus oedipus]